MDNYVFAAALGMSLCVAFKGLLYEAIVSFDALIHWLPEYSICCVIVLGGRGEGRGGGQNTGACQRVKGYSFSHYSWVLSFDWLLLGKGFGRGRRYAAVEGMGIWGYYHYSVRVCVGLGCVSG